MATYAPAFTPIVYFENVGNATRPAFVEAPSGQNPFDAVDAIHVDQTTLALHDVDADGDLDLLLAKLTGTAVYYANFGSSTAMDLVEDAEHGLNEASLGALATAPAVALGDLDGDGAAELLVGDQGGFLTYYANSYCQLASGDGACSLRGLCRAGDGRYAAAACECLSGTTGDQCEECRPGFWGADCDLCPAARVREAPARARATGAPQVPRAAARTATRRASRTRAASRAAAGRGAPATTARGAAATARASTRSPARAARTARAPRAPSRPRSSTTAGSTTPRPAAASLRRDARRASRTGPRRTVATDARS